MKRLVTGMLAAATLFGLSLTSAPTSMAAPEWDEFTTTLPEWVTAVTPFTVNVDGPDPICQMEYRGQVDTAAPWEFTFDPSSSEYEKVTITYCNPDLGTDSTYARAGVPFIVNSQIISLDADSNNFKSTNRLAAENRTDAPATLTVTNDKGKVIATRELAPQESLSSDFMGKSDTRLVIPLKGVKKSTTFTATIAGSGMTVTEPVYIAKGWTTMFGSAKGKYPPCTVVTWSYNKTGQPKNAKSFHKDVRTAFKMLEKVTGLKFKEVPPVGPPEENPMEGPSFGNAGGDGVTPDIRIDWQDLGRGLGGMGGSDGHVSINKKNFWPTDAYSGFGTYQGRSAGRGWLIIHEVMHTLLFDHVEDRNAVMNPVNHGQHAFGRGDLDGFKVLYPKCTV